MSLVKFEKIESNSVLEHLFLKGTKPAPIMAYEEPVNDIPHCHIYYQMKKNMEKIDITIYDIESSERQDNTQLTAQQLNGDYESEKQFIQKCVELFEQFFYTQLDEDATQASSFGGRVSLFGDKDNINFNYNDWYNQLFELKDYEDFDE